MSRCRRISQLAGQLGSLLQQTRGVKASTTKLPVVLLQDVEGLGEAGKAAKVSHGYARNFLIPQRLAEVPPSRPRGRGGAAAAAAGHRAAGGAAAQAAASSSGGLDEEAAALREVARQRKQVDTLVKRLMGAPLTIKRRTQPDSQDLERAITAQDISDAVARQLQIEMVPELLDMTAEDTLWMVGEYRIPMKLVLPNGERAILEVTVLST